MLRIIGLVALVGVTALHDGKITEVANMLTEMSSAAEAEAKTNKENFSKFECTQNKMIGDTSSSLAEATANLGRATADEESNKACFSQQSGNHEAAEADIKKYSKDIKAVDQDRASQASSYRAAKTARDNSIATLGQAVSAIETSGNFLQLGSLPGFARDMDMDLMKLLATLPLKETEHKKVTGLVQAKGSASEVKGLLKQMKEDQENDGKNADDSENQSQQTASRMRQKLVAMLAASKKKSAESGTEANSCKDKMVEAQMDKENAAAAKEKHEAQLADAKKALNEATVAHNNKQADLDAEVAGISNALEVLNSDDSRALFDRTSGVSLVQTGIRQKAIQRLLRASSSGLNLVQLSAKLNAIRAGAFDKIISEFQAKAESLSKELATDRETRDTCIDARNTNAEDLQGAKQNMELHDSSKDEAEAALENADNQISLKKDKISESQIMMKALGEQRKSENLSFQKIVGDQQATVSVLNKVSAALSQNMGSGGRHKGGVLGKINEIVNDAENSKRAATTEENLLQKDFTKNVAALNDEINDCNKAISVSSARKGQASKDRKEARDAYNAESDQKFAVMTDENLREKRCKEYVSGFDARIEKRNVEIEGIKSAVAILKGATLE